VAGLVPGATYQAEVVDGGAVEVVPGDTEGSVQVRLTTSAARLRVRRTG